MSLLLNHSQSLHCPVFSKGSSKLAGKDSENMVCLKNIFKIHWRGALINSNTNCGVRALIGAHVVACALQQVNQALPVNTFLKAYFALKCSSRWVETKLTEGILVKIALNILLISTTLLRTLGPLMILWSTLSVQRVYCVQWVNSLYALSRMLAMLNC